MNYSNGNSFNGGNSMCLGGGATYGSGGQAGDGTRPPLAAVITPGDPVWRI